MARLLFAAMVLMASTAHAQEEFFQPRGQMMRFQNRPSPEDGSGSCVQASISCNGAHHNDPASESLLVDSPYGPAELGGSWPERVARYARRRGMSIWNIEGSQTIRWIEWALRNGRHVAITYGQAHMIAAKGMSPDGRWFWIWDNNYPSEIRRVSRETFIREHRIHGGGWCVIHKGDGPPPWELPRADRTPQPAR